MAVMPAAVALFVCKVAFLPYANDLDRSNSAYTGYKPYVWAITHSKMTCRRLAVDLYNPGDPDAEFTPQKCLKASFQIRMAWDQGHANSNWRVWATGCPVKTINTESQDVLAWTLPSCPRFNKKDRVAVHCEVDTEI